MYQPADEQEQLLLQWAVACGLYSPRYFAVDADILAVYCRVLRNLHDLAAISDVDRYMQSLQWLNSAGQYLFKFRGGAGGHL